MPRRSSGPAVRSAVHAEIMRRSHNLEQKVKDELFELYRRRFRQIAHCLIDHVYLKPKLRKLLEEGVLTGDFRERYLRRCEQLHKRWRYFDPQPMADWLARKPLWRRFEGATETEQSSLSKLNAWTSASDKNMAALAKHIQSAKIWMAWGFIVLAALVLFRT